MKALFLGLALLAAAQATPAPSGLLRVEAHGHSNRWTFDAAPGALVAKLDGAEVWRRTGPFAQPTGLDVQIAPGRVILMSTDAKTSRVFLTAYDLETGRPLWLNKVYDGYAEAMAGVRGISGYTLLVQGSSGEPSFGKVFGVSLTTGKTLWTARQDVVGFDDDEVLVLDYGVGSPMNIPHLLPLVRVQSATGQQTKFTLTLPTRPGCGEMNYQGSIPDLRFTNRYLYALRQDACGKFIVRFPWQGDIHTAMVYPDRRGPFPANPPAGR
ncbi:hypothetical protein DAERI_030138 [Deinococcus aerius]|uniref:Uncharacterized protein n=1 Tax=Deinococcus aerius TaxID=200253 RepID=A0A2I9CT99_9DEIO|nr:PQQ-binding-like beta-propeller repeat protein [Deinococcus aerius]GBF04972.1 hypothetical protein DAERI_030138 [Deinococcus aerius]